MEKNLENLRKSIKHMEVLYKTFSESNNFSESQDWKNYNENYGKLSKLIEDPDIEIHKQLYNEKNRQMILADILEYIFLSRGYYFISNARSKEKYEWNKQKFIEIILRFVNVLMTFESMTADTKLRKEFLKRLGNEIPEIKNEELFEKLSNFKGRVGMKKEDSDADKELNRYFDKMLPKTAGGLWHELLVYVFLLRYDVGYIIPLLLHQKFLSGSSTLVPPDYLILTKEKNLYGIEVGIKKEIQSGSFSLSSNIPTATINTIDSRNSDRCPICKRWILFCDKVIEDFSDTKKNIKGKVEVKCLRDCDKFTKEQIARGICPYTKYARKKAARKAYTDIKFSDGKHYHYQCVLKSIPKKKKQELINAKDETALKTHYPYYSGLETLFK